jgi:hypothetical protein
MFKIDFIHTRRWYIAQDVGLMYTQPHQVVTYSLQTEQEF